MKTSQKSLPKRPKKWSAKKGENQKRTGSLNARKEFVQSRKLPTVSTTTKK